MAAVGFIALLLIVGLCAYARGQFGSCPALNVAAIGNRSVGFRTLPIKPTAPRGVAYGNYNAVGTVNDANDTASLLSLPDDFFDDSYGDHLQHATFLQGDAGGDQDYNLDMDGTLTADQNITSIGFDGYPAQNADTAASDAGGGPAGGFADTASGGTSGQFPTSATRHRPAFAGIGSMPPSTSSAIKGKRVVYPKISNVSFGTLADVSIQGGDLATAPLPTTVWGGLALISAFGAVTAHRRRCRTDAAL